MRHALSHPARVNKNQSRPVCLNQLRQPMIDFFPNFIRHHRFQRRFRHFDRQIEFATMTDVDDLAVRLANLIHRARADEKTSHFFDRRLRRR